MKYIAGTEKLLAEIAKRQNQFVQKVADATEQTAVAVSVDAASDHTRGFAHAIGRYENQTTTLTRSLLQSPRLVKVDEDEVVAEVGSNVEYAYPVEVRYPYLWPAAVKNQETFRRKLKEALGF